MKKSIIHITTFILATTVAAVAGSEMKDTKEISAPEVSSDAGAYIAIFGGANVAQNYDHPQAEASTPLLPGLGLNIDANHSGNNVGGVGGIKFGYNFNSFPIGGDFRLQPATEVEAFYVGGKLNETYNQNIVGTAVNANLSGDENNAVVMLNGLLRLKTGTCVTPYIGAGLGAEYIDLSNIRGSFNATGVGSGSTNFPSTDDVSFAAQAIGGLDFALANHWSIFTEYKYLVAVDPRLDFSAGSIAGIGINGNFTSDFIGQHIVTAGLKYEF